MSYDADKEPPVKLGHFLGDLELENPDKTLRAFVGAGPKQYALELEDAEGNISHTLKIRGITLDEENGQKLNYDVFKNMVLDLRSGKTPEAANTKNTRLLPIREKGVVSRDVVKQYFPRFNKGFLAGENCNLVYPFGFKSPSNN